MPLAEVITVLSQREHTDVLVAVLQLASTLFRKCSAPPLIQFQESIVYVAELALSDGTTVRVVARRIPWLSANQQAIEKHKTDVRQRGSVPNQPDVRIAVPFELSDGTRCFVEAALDPS